MNKKFSLEDLSKAWSPVSSTASISISIEGKQANTISAPTYLYYAMKAKMLANLGVSDEDEAIKLGLDIRKNLMAEIREIGKSVHRDLDSGNKNVYVSLSTQNRILSRILNEKEGGNLSLVSDKAESTNAYKTKKNVTIPNHIFVRLINLFGNKRAAKKYIHETVATINKELEEKSLIKDGVVIGEAGNSTWSKKLYNKIIFELISLSDIKELSAETSLLKIKMHRDIKIETKAKNGLL